MWFKNLFKSLNSSSSPQRSLRRRAPAARPSLEALEDRCTPSYSIVDLGTLGGYSFATAVNASAQVVGHSELPGGGPIHAFLWQRGVMTDLGTLGGSYSNATAINDAGQVVGHSIAAYGGSHGFLITPEDSDGNGSPDRWFRDTNADGRNDLMLDLGTIGPGQHCLAMDINNAGQVVGYSWNGTGDRAFLWQNGVMTDLGTFGGLHSRATAINDAGQVTGWATNPANDMRSFLWSGGVMTDIGAGQNSSAADINYSGQIAGTTSWTTTPLAHVWTPTAPNGSSGTITGLGVLPGDEASASHGMNDAGQVVGYSAHRVYSETGDYFDYRPFLYSNGVMQDLNALLPSGSDWSLTHYAEATAADINNAGVIVGTGYSWNPTTGQAQTHAYLMTPVSIGLPLVSIDDVSVIEGNAGTSNAVFTVRLSEASSQTVTVNYATVGGTATAGVDYLTTSGTVTFAPGQLIGVISVPVVGERVVDSSGTENFYVSLSNPGNAVLSDRTGIGAIVDDEPRIYADNVVVVEGNAAAVSAVFTVRLTNAYDQTVTVDYATSPNTAMPVSDYSSASGRLTFAPGETTKQVSVSVLGDRVPELVPMSPPDGEQYWSDEPETFYLNLSNAGSNTYVTWGGTGYIVDDEPRITADSVFVTEGHTGSTPAVVTVSLSNAYDQSVTVDYATADDSAWAGSDYESVSGSLTFAPGQMVKTIPVPVLGDRVGEPFEGFYFNLTNASSVAWVVGQGTVSIADDEPRAYLAPTYYKEVVEGDSGSTPVVFTVHLTAPYDQPVTVSFRTEDTGSAAAGSDYIAASGSVTFAAGETAKTFAVQVIGDTVYESDGWEESFLVQISATTDNASIYSDDYCYVAILNDDPVVPTVGISGVADYEGNTGTRTFWFTVSLSEPSAQTVTVNYATAGATATAGSDYVSVSGTVTFAPGETYKSVPVTVKGDRLPEADETFFVNLSSPTGAVLGNGQGVGTIYDDEPRISISDVSKKEGKKNQKTLFTFTVTLSVAYDQPVTMSFQTVNGTATTGDSDYIPKTGTLTFAPGETTKTITIEVKGDSKREANETFYLDLFGLSSNAVFAKNRGVGTILNDD